MVSEREISGSHSRGYKDDMSSMMMHHVVS
jgi:hypothetical protein